MHARDHRPDAAGAARRASERGTTLTETMIGLGLFLLLSGTMVQVTTQSRQLLDEQEEIVAATATAVTLHGCFFDPPVSATVTAAVAVAAVPSALGVAVDTVANFAVGDQVYLYSDDRWAYGTVTAVAAGPPAQLTVTVTGHRRQRRPGDPRGRQPDLSGRAHDLLARGWDAAAHALSGR